MLKLQNIPHNVLNAKHHEREAEIIAQAGLKGAVTIATNMAGRGTDIKLGSGVAELGGLAVIGTEHHQARRIDNQLRGRAGRQGDPGSSRFYASLEDDLLRLFGYERMSKWVQRLKIKEDEALEGPMVSRIITNAQIQVERNNFGIRKRLLEYDEVMNHQRNAIYSRRRNALFGDRLAIDLSNLLQDLLLSITEKYRQPEDAPAIQHECLRYLAFLPELSTEVLDPYNPQRIAAHLYEQAYAHYRQKRSRINTTVYTHLQQLNHDMPQIEWIQIDFTNDGHRRLPVVLPIREILETQGEAVFTEVEKMVSLSQIDALWVEHLRQMDDLRHTVQNAVYEQKDPLVVYKLESFKLFQALLDQLAQQILGMLFRIEIYQEQAATQQRRAVPKRDLSRLKATQASEDYYFTSTATSAAVPAPVAEVAAPEQPLSRRERRALERQKKKRAR